MRFPMLILVVMLAAPSLAQTIETITFEGLSGLTPIAYKPDDPVPKTARVKTITLQGGGRMRLRTVGGCQCAGLVTHMGTTAIVPVSRKGKIQQGRFVDIRLRKSPSARIDSLRLLNAGTRRGDDPSTTAVETDFVLGYDNPASVEYSVYEFNGDVLPAGGSSFAVTRLTPAPLDLTVTPLEFVRILIGRSGEMAYDDIVVSFGH